MALPLRVKSERWRVKSDCWKPHAVFFLFSLFSILSSLPTFVGLVGLDGFEPSTSRLSGARSNHLSYRPFSRFFLVRSIFPFGCRLCRLVEMMGFEPMTPCLQGRCSPNWATPPFVSHRGQCFFKDRFWSSKIEQQKFHTSVCANSLVISTHMTDPWKSVPVSIERRWSSRTFRYGYLVTT